MHVREMIEQQVLAQPWWLPGQAGVEVVKDSDLADGEVVVTPAGVFVGLRPLTFREEVIRDCVMIVRRGLRERWWGEVVMDPPTGREILRELGVPHPPEVPYPSIVHTMQVSVGALNASRVDVDKMVRGKLTEAARRTAYLDAAVLAGEPTILRSWVRPSDRAGEGPWVTCSADDLRATRVVYKLGWRVERFEEDG